MTAYALPGDVPDASPAAAFGRWMGAAALVVGVHGAAVWLAVKPRPETPALSLPPPAVLMDLDAAPAEAQEEAVPPSEPETAPPLDPPKPETPEPPVAPAEELPLPPPLDAVALPEPPPPVEKPRERPPERPPERVERRREPERPRPRPPTPPSAAQRSEAAPASAPGAARASAATSASWHAVLMAHLNRHKRYPGGAPTGTAQIAFTIDRGGRVLDARLVRSAGDSQLDHEAVAMVRRASPLPAPPGSMAGGGAFTLAVPIRFSR
jgi:periplasmic protein TonB